MNEDNATDQKTEELQAVETAGKKKQITAIVMGILVIASLVVLAVIGGMDQKNKAGLPVPDTAATDQETQTETVDTVNEEQLSEGDDSTVTDAESKDHDTSDGISDTGSSVADDKADMTNGEVSGEGASSLTDPVQLNEDEDELADTEEDDVDKGCIGDDGLVW